MSLRRALVHPQGLALLAASLLLAAATVALPALQRWSAGALWILALGALTYGATVIVAQRSRPIPSAPELRKLYVIRRAIEARLAERQAVEGKEPLSELTRVLTEAVVHLEQQVTPALLQLVERQKQLDLHLSRYEKGELPLPESTVLERLHKIRGRQQAAIDECVRQASNADATLVALLQEGDDTKVAARARAWAGELLSLHDSLEEVLRGEDEEAQPAAPAVGTVAVLPPPPEDWAPLEESPADVVPDAPVEQARIYVLPTASQSPEEAVVRLVEEALRRLNNKAALSTCGLVDVLPCTLEAVHARSGDGGLPEATPLQKAGALREVIILAVERLKPAEEASTGAVAALQYNILREEYVLGRPNSYIMTRLSISESTFHRNRREAILALAGELSRQEHVLSQGGLRDDSELPYVSRR